MIEGLSSHPELGKPDFANALLQHGAYIEALRACGLQVRILEADERYPDSCFIEDVAVCARDFSMVARPGAPSRLGEIEGMERVLRTHYERVLSVTGSGRLEGGDVMMVEDHFFIGLSSRTNREGARQLIAALEGAGQSGSIVEVPDILHLKTGLAYLGDGFLLATREFADYPGFGHFKKIQIEADEAYAANCVRINGRVLVPAGFPSAERRIREAGFSPLVVDTSEFRKLDGGLSCLSLRF